MTIEDGVFNDTASGQVLDHPFFKAAADGMLKPDEVAALVGQYWYPIHYFPTFLAGVVKTAPTTPLKTILSKILWQELGEGDPTNAHDSLYIETMVSAGISIEAITATPATPATTRLLDFYRAGTDSFAEGLGVLYGTEAIDLTIVNGLGVAVSKASGISDLPWVNIHVIQEPDHTESASSAVGMELGPDVEGRAVTAARHLWELWAEFFTALLP